MPAPVASAWSDRRVGLAPAGIAPPSRGARVERSFGDARLNGEVAPIPAIRPANHRTARLDPMPTFRPVHKATIFQMDHRAQHERLRKRRDHANASALPRFGYGYHFHMSTTRVAAVADPQAADDRPEHPELFISYASGDLHRAAALHAGLSAQGLRVWFDKIRLTPGCDWRQGDRGGLRGCSRAAAADHAQMGEVGVDPL
jgi:hypothetical protein